MKNSRFPNGGGPTEGTNVTKSMRWKRGGITRHDVDRETTMKDTNNLYNKPFIGQRTGG